MIDLPIAHRRGQLHRARDPGPQPCGWTPRTLVVVKICKSGGHPERGEERRRWRAGQRPGDPGQRANRLRGGVRRRPAPVSASFELALPAELNGPELLADLYVHGADHHQKPWPTVPTGPGLGVEVDEERIRAEARDLVFS